MKQREKTLKQPGKSEKVNRKIMREKIRKDWKIHKIMAHFDELDVIFYHPKCSIKVKSVLNFLLLHKSSDVFMM